MEEENPESVEEAGALLGAAITKCSATSMPSIMPPKGMHSSFATTDPVPSVELFGRLYQLRGLLKSCSREEPLVAAPSLLAVLMKLLGESSSLASKFVNDGRVNTPPLWSTPIRRLWVDCVVLCHVLGESLSGKARIDIFGFVKNMVALAGLNPKSQKATGGTRMAGLQVIGGLFLELPLKLSPWALDVLQLCHRSLKSSGNGEPSYRIAAVRTACCVAIASRDAHLIRHQMMQQENPMLMRGALEDRAIVESFKFMRHATTDKFPEVRQAAANLAGILAPMLLHQKINPKPGDSASTQVPPTTTLEDVTNLCIKNLDDEKTGVAAEWADALARCLAACIEYAKQMKLDANSANRRGHEQEDGGEGEGGSESESMRFSRGKAVSIASQCNTMPAAIRFLVDHFAKVGGELAASRGGSAFSSGGRAVRVGVSLALMKFLKLQSTLHNIGGDYTMQQVLRDVLNMVGPSLIKQFQPIRDSIISSDLTLSEKGSTLFLYTRGKSHADPGLARMATNRVIREGLSEVATEPTQLNILHELIELCGQTGEQQETGNTPEPLNPHQLQVVLIEISHLLNTLGEGAGSALEQLVPTLEACLVNANHGVRHEAAVACVALATTFPTEARKMFRKSVDEIQIQHAEIVTMATMEANQPTSTPKKRYAAFRLTKEDKTVDNSVGFQYAIHGYALLISLLMRELPRLPGGLPTPLLAMGLSVSEILISCQYIDILTKNNPGGACTCVRAGYNILCGGLTVGADAIIPHIALIFGLWQKAGNSVEQGGRNFTPDHDLICLDAALSSIVAFLEHCSELLLALPEALSRTTVMLEQLFPLFLPEGRLGTAPSSPGSVSRHESAKASILEAFAWLPPGSFPLVSNIVFTFALRHIQSGTESDVACSILPSLVNKEDKILDAVSISRAQRYGQVGGSREHEENLIVLTAEAAHHGERESVLHYQAENLWGTTKEEGHELWGSKVLGLYAYDGDESRSPPPTPLHEVGTWRKPFAPARASKVRLIDASVQAFAATFGLKDGKEQQSAMSMLESLVPPFLAQLSRAMGVNSSLTETERRSKTKDDNAAVANITAVLLACLKALPLHEATHDIPIGLGPPWMNRAKDLLLTLLPSTSSTVRRAAAEGLALLATLGVTEDAHTLQSAVLHSLDEVMQGNKPDGKPRAMPLEPVSAARAGSLLTLACIQRTAHNIKMIHHARSKGKSTASETAAEAQRLSLPTIQMMTRILPSIACHAMIRDAFVVRTYAMHSFALLVAYSATLKRSELMSVEDKHLLKKALEVVEDNFVACWTAVSADMDQGQEPEKLAAEASFLAVLLRMMTFLVPNLCNLEVSFKAVATRFARMATVAMEEYDAHPVVLMEGMAFFQLLAEYQAITEGVNVTDSEVPACIPIALECITPRRPYILSRENWKDRRAILSSSQGIFVGVFCVRLLVSAQASKPWSEHEIPPVIFSLLEDVCGSRKSTSATYFRPLASPREADEMSSLQLIGEIEILKLLDTLLAMERTSDSLQDRRLLRWILFCRLLLTGSAERGSSDDSSPDSAEYSRAGAIRWAGARSLEDVSSVFETANPCRWQVRSQAGKICGTVFETLLAASSSSELVHPDLDPVAANSSCTKRCREMVASRSDAPPPSYVVFHLPEIISSACGGVVASLDQFELRHVQEVGVKFLSELLVCFGKVPDPDQAGVSLLEQFSSQILSVVKHAVTFEGEDQAAYDLFSLGCMALELVLKVGLISDPMVFKRLVRPVIPLQPELPYSKYGQDSMPLRVEASVDDTHNSRVVLQPRIQKLSALSRITIMTQNGVLSSEVASFVIDEVKSYSDKVGINCAAVAIDGARILKGAGLTLTGRRESKKGSSVDSSAGLMYGNVSDLDTTTKAAFSRAWPSCLCYGSSCLMKAATSEGVDDEARKTCTDWLNALIPLAFSGFHDAAASLVPNQDAGPAWAAGLSADEILVLCLKTICEWLKSSMVSTEDGVKEEISFVIATIAEAVLFPGLGLEQSEEKGDAPVNISNDTMIECCRFLEEVATSTIAADGVVSSLLLALLSPLDAVQRGKISASKGPAASIIPHLLNGVNPLISQKKVPDSLTNAMLQLAVELSSSCEEPSDTVRAGESMLAVCLESDAIDGPKQSLIGLEIAKEEKWAAWAVICSRSDTALSGSIGQAREALANRNQAALSAIRTVVAATPTKVGIVMRGAGAQIMTLLRAYGTMPSASPQERTVVCADCMKILLVSYSQLDETALNTFLPMVFGLWIELIRFNGLPNQASPQAGADPTIGRVMAQAIVHVVRTTPAAFKNSMSALPDHSRAVLEFAVRADMSGYTGTNTQTPAKKKLDLKGFKK